MSCGASDLLNDLVRGIYTYSIVYPIIHLCYTHEMHDVQVIFMCIYIYIHTCVCMPVFMYTGTPVAWDYTYPMICLLDPIISHCIPVKWLTFKHPRSTDDQMFPAFDENLVGL